MEAWRSEVSTFLISKMESFSIKNQQVRTDSQHDFRPLTYIYEPRQLSSCRSVTQIVMIFQSKNCHFMWKNNRFLLKNHHLNAKIIFYLQVVTTDGARAAAYTCCCCRWWCCGSARAAACTCCCCRWWCCGSARGRRSIWFSSDRASCQRIISNAQSIISNAQFIISNAQFIISNAQFTSCQRIVCVESGAPEFYIK